MQLVLLFCSSSIIAKLDTYLFFLLAEDHVLADLKVAERKSSTGWLLTRSFWQDSLPRV